MPTTGTPTSGPGTGYDWASLLSGLAGGGGGRRSDEVGEFEGIFHEVVELVHVLEVAVADEFVALGPHGVLAHDAAPTPIIFASLEFNLRGGPHSGMAC
jgi:hypothetical protein